MKKEPPKDEDDEVAARRVRLDRWIAEHYPQQSDFIKDTGLNQGLVSAWINGSKSFREKAAMSVEAATQVSRHPMPPNYLKRPLIQEEATNRPGAPPDLVKMVDTLASEVLMLQNVLNIVLMSVERSIPAAGAEIETGLEKLPQTANHRYLEATLNAIRNARAAKASEQLLDLRQKLPSKPKKTGRQALR